jgi:hypothetical protein
MALFNGESLDIDQIEGRKNGEQAWKLSNGEYCISHQGIMSLALLRSPPLVNSQLAPATIFLLAGAVR